MPKITLIPVQNVLGNPNAVALALNENFVRIAAAFENTLSRDGTEPNQLEADLDLNGNAITQATFGPEVVIVDA